MEWMKSTTAKHQKNVNALLILELVKSKPVIACVASTLIGWTDNNDSSNLCYCYRCDIGIPHKGGSMEYWMEGEQCVEQPIQSHQSDQQSNNVAISFGIVPVRLIDIVFDS